MFLHAGDLDVRYQRAYIGGTFDVLHSGHVALFRRAKDLADEVVVSVNTDAFAEAYKRKPLVPLSERCAVVEACRYVDRVIVNTGGADSKPAILAAAPDCIIHGDDWTGDALLAQMGLTYDWLTAHRISMVYMPYTAGVSTTKLRGLNG